MSKTRTYSSHIPCDEGEELDPRIQVELEKLNVATDEINQLEASLEDANNQFRSSLTETSNVLQSLAKRLGSCVDKSRPYYQAREAAKRLQLECQRAAIQYQRANAVHQAARETISLAEERFSKAGNLDDTYGREFDSAWQEMLNHATIKVMEAEVQRMASEREHQERAAAYTSAEKEVQELQKKLKSHIVKSQPYFNQRIANQVLLETQKAKIHQLQIDVASAKLRYSRTLKNLEQISEEIHESRRATMKREPGVGAEFDPDDVFVESGNKPPSKDSEYWTDLRGKLDELKKMDTSIDEERFAYMHYDVESAIDSFSVLSQSEKDLTYSLPYEEPNPKTHVKRKSSDFTSMHKSMAPTVHNSNALTDHQSDSSRSNEQEAPRENTGAMGKQSLKEASYKKDNSPTEDVKAPSLQGSKQVFHEVPKKVDDRDAIKGFSLNSKEHMNDASLKENTKDSPPKELTTGVSPQKDIKEISPKENTKRMSSKESIKEATTKENSNLVSSKENMKEIPPKENAKLLSPKENMKEISPKESNKQISPKENVQETSTSQEDTKLVSPKENIKEVSKENAKVLSPKESTKLVSHKENTRLASRNENIKEAPPKETINEVSPKENVKEVSPKENIKEVSPKENIKEVSPKENVNEVSPKENIKEVSPKENVKEVSPKENIKEVSPKENMKEVSPKENIKEVSPKENIKVPLKQSVNEGSSHTIPKLNNPSSSNQLPGKKDAMMESSKRNAPTMENPSTSASLRNDPNVDLMKHGNEKDAVAVVVPEPISVKEEVQKFEGILSVKNLQPSQTPDEKKELAQKSSSPQKTSDPVFLVELGNIAQSNEEERKPKEPSSSSLEKNKLSLKQDLLNSPQNEYVPVYNPLYESGIITVFHHGKAEQTGDATQKSSSINNIPDNKANSSAPKNKIDVAKQTVLPKTESDFKVKETHTSKEKFPLPKLQPPVQKDESKAKSQASTSAHTQDAKKVETASINRAPDDAQDSDLWLQMLFLDSS